jgi:DNA-binding LytR/AlgR family response regulator
VGGLVTLLFLSLDRREGRLAEVAGSASPAVPVAAPSFLERLPPSWAGQLRALEMEDHYVRAHGPSGQSRLILMRMADAVRELGEADGLQVHRSWWVARRAIDGSRREGRKLRLKLDGGREVPVARDRVAAVRAAGWLR